MKELICSTEAYRIFFNDYTRGESSHAYLISFADEKNLRAALKEFAKTLFPDERIRKLIDKEEFSDCKIYPQRDKKYGVDLADEIIYESGMRSVEGGKKVFVLDNFSAASEIVQNKLLKTFEEPPADVIFVIGAVNLFSLLPTVLSRLRKLEIQPFPPSAVGEYLKRNYPGKENYSSFAAASSGNISLAENLLIGGYFESLKSFIVDALTVEEKDIPSLNAKLGAIKEKNEFLSLLRSVLKDVAVSFVGIKPAILSNEESCRIRSLYPISGVIACAEYITEAEKQLKFNAVFPRLTENLLITFLKNRK